MIVQINEKEKKQEIAYKVLSALPEWFGIPEALEEYIINSTKLPFWAEIEDNEARGFIVVRMSITCDARRTQLESVSMIH